MLDLFKKSLYASIGLAMVSREKAEQLGKKIAKEAEMSEAQGRKFVEDIVKKSEETKLTIERMVQNKVEAVLKKTAIPTRRELNELRERIGKLEGASSRRGKKAESA
ncbi:MAG: phasin family protein [Chitinispirillaceae bacterium]|nr:phasin family protein [Chitinispirillaceae bacterium]